MGADYTEIVVILDRSGSMQTARNDHEGGLRSFVDDQKQLAGDVRFTLIQFDDVDPCEVVYDGVPISQVDKIGLIPRGCTPLLDAIGRAAAHVQKRLKDQKPDQVVVMVITDGEENASREYSKAQVRQLIAEAEKNGWKFLYLGANVDAFAEAGKLGVATAASLGYRADSGKAVKSMYCSVSANTLRARSMLQAGGDPQEAACCYNFSAEQRASAQGNSAESNPKQVEPFYGSLPGGRDSQADQKAGG